MTVAKEPDRRGEDEANRKTIARGMPGDSGVTVATTCTLFAAAHRRPAFPAPSDERARKFKAKPRALALRGRMCFWNESAVIAMLPRANKNKSPARRGNRAGLSCPVALAALRPDIVVCRSRWPLLDHLNDAARARFDQHGLAVHHGVAIRRGAIGLRHVVIGDAGFRQHTAHDHTILNGVVRHPLAHDVFAERRPPIDGDAVDVVVDDHAAAAHDADGVALRLRRDRYAHGACDCCNGKYLVPHVELLCDDARRSAPARNASPIHRAWHRSLEHAALTAAIFGILCRRWNPLKPKASAIVDTLHRIKPASRFDIHSPLHSPGGDPQ